MQSISKYKKIKEQHSFLQISNYGIFLFIFCFLAINSTAQSIQYNSTDTSLVYALIDSTNKIKRNDRVAAEKFAQKGIELADKIGEPMARARARLNQSVLNLNQFQPISIQLLWETIDICKEANLPHQMASAYNNLGLNYRQAGKLDSAMYCHQECLAFAKKNDISELVWKSKLGITRIYKGNGQEKEAERELLETWDYIEKKDIRMAKGMTIYHLADLYWQNNNNEAFVEWQEKWQNYVVGRYNSIEELISPSHYNLSLFFEDFHKTLSRFDTIIAIHTANKDTARMGMAYFDLANTYRKEKKYELSLAAFQKGEPFMKSKMGPYFLIGFYQTQYETAKNANKIPLALSSYEKYQNLITQVRKSEMDKQIAELEIKYETNEKEAQIAKASQEKNFLVTVFSLVALLAGFIIWSLRNRLKIKEQLSNQATKLQEQKIRQLEQEQQLFTYDAMLEGQEQERARIARELHDGLGGLLTTVKAHFNSLNVSVDPDRYLKTNKLIDAACTEVRQISHNMMPHALMLSGLSTAIEELAANLESNGINCDLEMVAWQDDLLPNNRQVMLYRVIQELVQNIQKHAAANQVLIQLLRHKNELTLIVEDDGQGFDKNKLSVGLGLKNIKSRVQFLKGEIDIDSVPKEGTTTTVRIPLDPVLNSNLKVA